MDKKLRLSITYVVLLSILIGSAILISKPVDKSRYDSKATDNQKWSTVVADNSQESVKANKNDVSKSETISVFHNGSDIDIHANLVENKNGQVSLNLVYKANGKLITKNIDTSNVTEIRNIFRFREKYGSGYRLNNMILNKKMNKLYFCVEGKKDKNYIHTTIYSYGLQNSKIEKIYYDIGAFSDFSISPDGKYNAFSYVGSPQNIIHNERNIAVIIRCLDNKLVLNSNVDIIRKQYGNINDIYIYSYSFIKWRSDSICELSEKIKSKDGSQKVKVETVYYNVISNQISDKIQ